MILAHGKYFNIMLNITMLLVLVIALMLIQIIRLTLSLRETQKQVETFIQTIGKEKFIHGK